MSSDLTSQKCEACTIDAPKVTKEESDELIKTLDNWITSKAEIFLFTPK